MLSRVEHEMNLNWAEQNPALFVKAVRDFQSQYPTNAWEHSVNLGRLHYITLIAKAYVRE